MRITLTTLLLAHLATPIAARQEAFIHPLSAAPGERVDVYVSTSAASYKVVVSRSHFFNSQTPLMSSALMPGVVQPVTSGSFAAAPDHPSLDITGNISLEAWVRPIAGSATAFRGILMKYSNPGETAYGIYFMPGGQVSFYLGATGIFNTANRLLTTNPLPLGKWTHVVATYDGETKRIYLDGELDESQPRTGPIFDSAEPLRVGSFGSPGTSMEGDVDSAAVYLRALTPAEIEARFVERAQYTSANPGVLPGCVAQYNFDEMVGDVLADVSGNSNDLTLQNHATRGIPGPLIAGASGKPENWAIRFSNADTYNPPWEPGFSFVVPPDWESGFYAVRILSLGLPFIVKPRPSEQARIAVLANTNTWAAYNSWSQSLYEVNPGGSINRYVGLLQPSPNALLDLHQPGGSFSPRVDAERYLYAWLDENGYDFDIYTDLDLHQSSMLLEKYRVLVIQGHSEYWSTEMVDHVVAFLDAGGSVINLSGNTMWSRVTFDPTFTVMEGRKHPWAARPSVFPASERWHSQAGQVLGGTLRCVGRPEHEVLGTGYGIICGNGNFGTYSVLAPEHWVFAGTGVTEGTLFGETSQNGNAILGHEFDVVLPQWSPANIEILARGTNFVGTDLDISDCATRVTKQVTKGGDMVYFDHPGGGGVFGAPTVAYGGTLFVDAVTPKILDNVLRRFVERPIVYCTAKTNSCGSLPAIDLQGSSSASLVSGFTISASNTRGTQAGLLLYTDSGGASVPFSGGTLCLNVVPLKRSVAVVDSNGTPGHCNGTLSIDMNTFAAGLLGGNPLPSLAVPGTQVNCQFWGRDTIANGALLSDALEYFVGV